MFTSVREGGLGTFSAIKKWVITHWLVLLMSPDKFKTKLSFIEISKQIWRPIYIFSIARVLLLCICKIFKFGLFLANKKMQLNFVYIDSLNPRGQVSIFKTLEMRSVQSSAAKYWTTTLTQPKLDLSLKLSFDARFQVLTGEVVRMLLNTKVIFVIQQLNIQLLWTK